MLNIFTSGSDQILLDFIVFLFLLLQAFLYAYISKKLKTIYLSNKK